MDAKRFWFRFIIFMCMVVVLALMFHMNNSFRSNFVVAFLLGDGFGSTFQNASPPSAPQQTEFKSQPQFLSLQRSMEYNDEEVTPPQYTGQEVYRKNEGQNIAATNNKDNSSVAASDLSVAAADTNGYEVSDSTSDNITAENNFGTSYSAQAISIVEKKLMLASRQLSGNSTTIMIDDEGDPAAAVRSISGDDHTVVQNGTASDGSMIAPHSVGRIPSSPPDSTYKDRADNFTAPADTEGEDFAPGSNEVSSDDDSEASGAPITFQGVQIGAAVKKTLSSSPARGSQKRTSSWSQSMVQSPPALPCGWTAASLARSKTRLRASLVCPRSGSPKLSFKRVPSSAKPSITTVPNKNRQCLKRFIRQRCMLGRGQRIPGVAHFVRFGRYNLRLDGFISIISVARNMKPCVILLHSDVIPHGPLWKALLQLVPQILHVPTKRPRRILGRKINVVEHSADVARLRILQEYGGVYLDTDYFIIRPLDDLYKNPAVVGMETKKKICNGFLLAEPNSQFIRLWLNNYKDFKDREWTEHSGSRPYRIAMKNKKTVRMVWNFHSPNYLQIPAYFSRSTTPKKYRFRQMYGLHLYTRVVFSKVFSATRIDRQNNVIGDVVRHVLHGNANACLGVGKGKK